MVSTTVKVINESGLHARPASTFVKAAAKFKDCSVSIQKNGRTVNGKSIVAVLSASICCGETVELIVDGDSEQEALAALKAEIESGLGE